MGTMIRFFVMSACLLCGAGMALVTVLLLTPVSAATSLKEPPDNFAYLQGKSWAILGDFHYHREAYPAAANAYRNSFRVIWQQAERLNRFAEALTLTHQGQVSDEAREVIGLLLAQQPDYPGGLWMAAVAATQRGEYAAAHRHLSSLWLQMPKDSEDARHVWGKMLKLDRKISGMDGGKNNELLKLEPFMQMLGEK